MGDLELSREEIRALLAEELDLDESAIAFDDDLINHGLHSMQMIKIAAGWRRRGLDVVFSDLALCPTIQGWYELLAERADRAAGGTEEPARQPEQSGPHPEGEPFGLATMQHGYWIGRADGQQLGGVAAHLYAEFDGRGVDPARLERAVQRLVQRHQMLRSQFLNDGTQRILDRPGQPVWSVTDLRDAAADRVERELEAIRDHKTHQRMRADLGKVLDVSLTLLPEGHTRLHVDVDMLAADALSYRLMLADLADFYTSEDDWQPEPFDYGYRDYLADYAKANAAAHQREGAWWQELLPQLPDAPALPLVPERQRTDPHRTVRYNHWLDPESKRRLTERAHRYGVTPASVLASVFADVVGTWSGEQRFLLNLPLFNREPLHRDVEHLVGDFSSSVLLDVDVSRPDTLLGRAKQFQQTLHSRASHAAYPGLDVLRDIGRLRGEPTLASVVYTSGLNLGELFRESVLDAFGEPVWIISQGPQVVLDAQVVELRGGLLLNWDVREQAFPPGMMDAMFARNRETIERLLGDGDAWEQPVDDRLPAQQASVRRQCNETARDLPEKTLHQDFFAHAEAAPEAVALLWGDQEQLSYGALRDRALRVAGALAARGVRPGASVSVQLPKGPDQIVAVLGVLAAGASYVPIGADQPEARRDRIEATGDVVLALVDGGGRGPDGRVPALPFAEAVAWADPLPEPVPTDPESIAYVLFTSGSTGQPKGVEIPHAAAMNTLQSLNEYFGVRADDRALALSPMEFDLSVYDVFGLLSAGGSIAVPDEETRRDGRLVAELIDRCGVTVLNCVPGLFDMILASGRLAGQLRVVVLGGDWVGTDLPGRLHRILPACRFAGLGGTTETAIHSTVCEVAGPVPDDWHAIPYGFPLANVACRVVNEAGADCPEWVPGELWIGGRGVARGYRNDPERTADRFVEYQGRRWYRTGDLARYRPGGMLEFLGRRDHQKKIRGHRIELGEVEAALRSVPSVRQAAVEVLEQGARQLVAAVSWDAGTPGDEQALGKELAALLPPYMLPERFEVLDELPLTDNGKIDRKAVRAALVATAAPSEGASVPANDLEAVLAGLIGEVLGLGSVAADQDFFVIGGDSVLATTVIARVREWLDTSEPTVADLFATRTVRELAARLAERQSVPGRIEQAAQIYLQVTAMPEEEVLADSESSG